MWPYLAAGAGVIAASVAAVAYLFPWVKYDLHVLKKMLGGLKILRQFKNDGITFIDLFEKKCRQIPQKPMIIFQVRVQPWSLLKLQSLEVCVLYVSDFLLFSPHFS